MIIKIKNVRVINGSHKSFKAEIYTNSFKELNIIRRFLRIRFKASFVFFDYEEIV